MGSTSMRSTAPPARWARKVSTLETAARANRGAFSRTSRGTTLREVILPRGQTSRSSRAKGKVTSMGLAMRPRPSMRATIA